MFVEILFFKSSREAQEIQDGYGTTYNNSTTTKKSKSDKSSFTTEEEDELVLLAEEYNSLPDEGVLIYY